ncbi:outer membrane protein TolC [Dysgonomonas alginatilytica]|uniref:Outer membrane protein TolC n=2 Tax=Dysgonomonas alginatilytica TaxID=1605892 RepID=A0A2V3PTN4_9BACT|nr:outer membrane protein TolC [Dysgonomonas alginatilytica]
METSSENMKKILLILCVLINGCFMASAQLTIEACQEKAKQNYPLIKRYGLIEKTKEYNLSNAGKGYLPQFSMSAKATYQSDVPHLPISVPGVNIRPLSQDQYGVTLDVNQSIWDGGVISSKKEMAKTASEVAAKQLEVNLYTINDRVNQLYFGILLFDAKIKQNQLLQEELERNFNLISSYIENGVANQSDLDAIKVEQLKTIQTQTQLASNRKAFIDMLSVLIGESINENTVLEKPNSENQLLSSQIGRPELHLFDAQYNDLETQKKQIKAGYMPKLGLFATGGYGRPGLNMLEDKFAAYYIAGVRLSWNFGGLYTEKNDHKLIEANQSSLAAEKETFLFNTNLEVTQEQSEVKRNRDLLKYDDDIITLRNNVKKSAEVKVANGTLTVTDLMREVNAEDLAKQDKIQHEIELLLSIYNLKYTTNK